MSRDAGCVLLEFSLFLRSAFVASYRDTIPILTSVSSRLVSATTTMASKNKLPNDLGECVVLILLAEYHTLTTT
jgi:hypothetical protein